MLRHFVGICIVVFAMISATANEVQAETGIPLGGVLDCATALSGPFPDICVSATSPRTLISIDLKVLPEFRDEGSVIVEVPNRNIRTTGTMVQIFYNGPAGKAIWYPIASLAGVILSPSGISLPIGRWMESGLKSGQFIRLVIAVNE